MMLEGLLSINNHMLFPDLKGLLKNASADASCLNIILEVPSRKDLPKKVLPLWRSYAKRTLRVLAIFLTQTPWLVKFQAYFFLNYKHIDELIEFIFCFTSIVSAHLLGRAMWIGPSTCVSFLVANFIHLTFNLFLYDLYVFVF